MRHGGGLRDRQAAERTTGFPFDFQLSTFNLFHLYFVTSSLLCVAFAIIGIFTPAFFANSFASSYPASTCRATPIPGSLVNTRSIRDAISFVPSATVTCPACCEYPIPTPPPL